MGLELYRQKRSFKKTPEPTAGTSTDKHLHFVIQKHQASHLHYDFRLEVRGVLKSWAVPKGPSLNQQYRRLAQLVEDHPYDYKDFEGIIPTGNYGAGTVIIWDKGTYVPQNSTGHKEEDEKILTKQFYAGKIAVVLKGKKLKGLFLLIKTPVRGENAWLLSKADDKDARKTDVTKKDKSVVSGLTIEQMSNNKEAASWKSNRSAIGTKASRKRTRAKRNDVDIRVQPPEIRNGYKSILQLIKREFKGLQTSSMPIDLEPMLATLSKEVFNHKDWLFEIKWDGYRSLAYVNEGNVELRSRSNLSYSETYTPIVDALKDWNINAVVDGEITVLDEEGKADFQAMQNYKRQRDVRLVYYVFDILWLDGISMMKLPLYKRKEFLQKLVPDSSVIKYSDSIEEYGEEFFELAKKNDLEGIVAKRKDSLYYPGQRTKDWLKMPSEIRQEFVIGGWTESDSAREFKSLLFGYYQDGDFIYAGHSGGGFKEKEMRGIMSQLKPLEIKTKPFKGQVETDKTTHWVKPELVAEIKYASLTSSGKIRKPAIFLGLRTDKNPKDIKKEIEIPKENWIKDKAHGKTKKTSTKEPVVTSTDSNWPELENQTITSTTPHEFDGKEVMLTNVEKSLWKGFTKAHLLMYYHSVYDYIIPHLKERPLSLHIKHNGPTAPGLYMKDMEGRQPEWAEIFTTPRLHKKKGKRDVIDYLVCNDEATLQYVVNLGCIDINPWTSKTSSPNNPDYVIIDLDPSDDDFSKAIETAKAAKQFFDQYKIKAFPKTSGKTGIHLYLPCCGFDFAHARTIAENICTGIHDLVPSITTTNVSINSRGNKLYIDPNQNDFADTVAAPYSVRPSHQPTVSTPLEWKEIKDGLHPTDFTVKKVLQRLKKKGDLFKPVLDEKTAVKNKAGLSKFI